MPVPCTTDDFLTLVRKSGVADAAALDDFAQRLTLESQPPRDPQQLASRMLREGLLTVLQATNLLRGKWRNFVICGKYKLLEHLGTGGMGKVYLCEHARMRRRVAIKILPPDRAEEAVSRVRFEREAEALAALNHPNIVRAHDIDYDDKLRLHFIVMEYVDGSSLQEIVKRGGPLPVLRACHYVRQAALGLKSAHDAGWFHRDIKPANLLLERSGLVKILDLGLTRSSNDDSNLTRQYSSSNTIGTADYVAPEQALNSQAADIRADIYSLGVTFYFLLTGRSPFRDGTVAQKLLYHQFHLPEPVKSFRPEVPDDLARIIDRMLAKNPDERHQTPAEVVEALDPWTETPIPPPPESEMPNLSRAARRAEPPTTPLPLAVRSTLREFQKPKSAAPTARSPAAGRRARLWKSLAAALLIAVAVAAIWVVWLGRST
jgi:serine/threonine protein kinase